MTHPGIGFVLVRSQQWGPLAIGRAASATWPQAASREDPLAGWLRLPEHLCRTDSFAHAPDVLVNNFYDPIQDEGAAFEELIGFHGSGRGPILPLPACARRLAHRRRRPDCRAEMVYQVLKRQLGEMSK